MSCDVPPADCHTLPSNYCTPPAYVHDWSLGELLCSHLRLRSSPRWTGCSRPPLALFSGYESTAIKLQLSWLFVDVYRRGRADIIYVRRVIRGELGPNLRAEFSLHDSNWTRRHGFTLKMACVCQIITGFPSFQESGQTLERIRDTGDGRGWLPQIRIGRLLADELASLPPVWTAGNYLQCCQHWWNPSGSNEGTVNNILRCLIAADFSRELNWPKIQKGLQNRSQYKIDLINHCHNWRKNQISR